MTLLRISRAAEREASEAADWYEARQPTLGGRFLAALTDVLAKIEKSPSRFAREPSYQGWRDFRQARIERYPYVVIFEVKPDRIVVVQAIAHASRRPGYWHGQVE